MSSHSGDKSAISSDQARRRPVISAGIAESSLLRGQEQWNWAVRLSVVGLFVIALGAVLNLLAHVVVPLVLAWVVATVLLPAVALLNRFRLPRAVASAAIVALLLAGLAFILVILTVPLSYWFSRTQELSSLVKQKLALIERPLEVLDELGSVLRHDPRAADPSVYVTAPKSDMLSTMFDVLTPAVDEFMIFVMALVFHLIYQREIQNGIAMLARGQDAERQIRELLGDIETSMSGYFSTVTIINAIIGLAAMGIAFLLGYPHPILWGVLAAVLNFIPYLGPALVLATLFVVGVIVFPTLQQAAFGPLLFLALTALEGQVISPALVGHRLTINPFMVFLSIAFWTWMWGPLGAFLAVPILVTAMVMSRHLKARSALPSEPGPA
jgi:predicted PurR-regulated permease PerM